VLLRRSEDKGNYLVRRQGEAMAQVSEGKVLRQLHSGHHVREEQKTVQQAQVVRLVPLTLIAVLLRLQKMNEEYGVGECSRFLRITIVVACRILKIQPLTRCLLPPQCRRAEHAYADK